MSPPVTQAVRVLREHGVTFVPHLFAYKDKGGTAHSSVTLGVSEHAIIKTLIFEDEKKQPLCILMHGDREVSTKQLARLIGCKMVKPCAPETANKHSGYMVGGTSPFGLRQPMPVYMQESIQDLPRIYINGGGRGFLVEIAPADLVAVVSPVIVDAMA